MVHGYTGSYLDLKPLADELTARFGKDSVTNLTLPGRDSKNIPEFNEDLFIETIYDSIKAYRNENHKLIIIGHSTGGSLALATLTRYSIKPELLILIAVPHKINWDYFQRWETHRSGKAKIPLVDLSMIVKLINSTGSKRFESKFPDLLIHGEDDELVLASESDTLNTEVFSGSARVITIPQTGHDIFKRPNSRLIIVLIRRAISDISLAETKDEKAVDSLINVEPGFKDFFKAAPISEGHLVLCPSAQRVIEKAPELLPRVLNRSYQCHGLEEFGIEQRYHDFLLIPPGQLYNRSKKRTWCFSPWQTIPIDVDGNVTICDCRPEFVIGNLFQKPFSQIWNGEALQKYRIEMLSEEPPEACQICPRF